jgi:hypothetical protein
VADWTISVVASAQVKGKPLNWFPRAEQLVKVGVPLRIARRWERERYQMTAGLRRRVRQNQN